MTYPEYLRTEHWRLLRGAKLQTSPRCERCGSGEELEVHHQCYQSSWFKTRVRDLRTLCHGCHVMEHAREWGWKPGLLPAPKAFTPYPNAKASKENDSHRQKLVGINRHTARLMAD